MMEIITDFDIDGMRQGIFVHDKMIRQAGKPASSFVAILVVFESCW